MFLDSRQLPSDSTLETTIAIVGSGPAGLSVALELAGTAVPVLLLESGGVGFDNQAQDLAEAEVSGVPLLAPRLSRYRGFGGTARRWAGFCRPLDPDDFEARDWLPYSGWPIDAQTMASYYDAALKLAGIAEGDWNPIAWREGGVVLDPETARSEELLPANLYRSPVRNFRKTFAATMRRAANVTVLHHANVTEIETDEHGRTVSALRVACLDGKRFTVKAHHFVLAAGGIENARLLLASTAAKPAGLGNDHDLVGRFLMNHPHMAAAWLSLSHPDSRLHSQSQRTNAIAQRLTLADTAMARAQVAKFSAYLYPVAAVGDHPFTKSQGFAALLTFLGRDEERLRLGQRFAAVGRIASDLGGLTHDVAERLRAPFTGRNVVAIVVETEQIPNPDSRVTLSPELDALGMRRARIDWRLHPRDKETMRVGLEHVERHVSQHEIGELTYNDWILSEGIDNYPGEDWAHHAGTTRMASDPKQGVVDADTLVHGMTNLYMGGCSIFPTEGIAPPTLTILAFGIRLAERLKKATT